MPTYEITDEVMGRTYEVDSPVKLTNAQIMKAVQSKIDEARAVKARYDKEAEQVRGGVVDEMGTMDRLVAGAGHGFQDIGRKAVNLALPESLEPEWATDEAIHEDKETAERLLDTPAGLTGSIGAQVLATAPVSGGAGAASKGLLARTLAKGGQVGAVGKTLVGGVEGAAGGLLMSDPGNRVGDAAMGFGIGNVLTGTGQVLKKTFGTGLAKLTPEAKKLQDAGIDVPLGLGAEPGMIKTLYRDWLPAMPFVRKEAMRQSDEAFDAWRQTIAKKTLPDWAKNRADDLVEPQNFQGTMDNLRKFWLEEAYEPFNKIPFRPTWMSKSGHEIYRKLSPQIRNLYDREMARLVNAADDTVTGNKLMSLKQIMSDHGKKLARGNRGDLADEAYEASKMVDSILENQLKLGASGKGSTARNQEIYKKWMDNKKVWGSYLDMRKAAKGALDVEGKFTPKQLMKASGSRAGEVQGVAGRGALQKTAQAGNDALGKPIADPGFWRTMATYGLLGGGALVSPVTTAAALGGGRGMVTPGFQRMMSGNAGYQKAIAELLRRNPALRSTLQAVGQVGQTATINAGTR